MKSNKYRAIQLELKRESGSPMLDWFRYAWGLDIWFHNLPLCKTMLLVNLIVWVVLYVS